MSSVESGGGAGRKILITRARICDYLCVGKQAFYRLVRDGLPVEKRGKLWSGHIDDIDDFFRVPKRP